MDDSLMRIRRHFLGFPICKKNSELESRYGSKFGVDFDLHVFAGCRIQASSG